MKSWCRSRSSIAPATWPTSWSWKGWVSGGSSPGRLPADRGASNEPPTGATTRSRPPSDTLLDRIKAANLPVVAIGKIEDLFAGRGITRAIHTGSDDDGVDQLERQMAAVDRGLIFVNLVDFDTVYGHRNDVDGYAGNLERFDRRLAGAAAASAPERCAGRHRRSRQRSDDAQHRSRARVRAASRHRPAGAGRRGSRHPPDVRRSGPDPRRHLRRRAARPRHELSARRSRHESSRRARGARARDSRAARPPRAPTRAAVCAKRRRTRSVPPFSATAIASSTARRSGG